MVIFLLSMHRLVYFRSNTDTIKKQNPILVLTSLNTVCEARDTHPHLHDEHVDVELLLAGCLATCACDLLSFLPLHASVYQALMQCQRAANHASCETTGVFLEVWTHVYAQKASFSPPDLANLLANFAFLGYPGLRGQVKNMKRF